MILQIFLRQRHLLAGDDAIRREFKNGVEEFESHGR